MNTGRAVLTTLVVAVACAVPGTGVARAADEIGVSYDGSEWSTALPTPLFDPDVRWVPGDQRAATFFIRNQAGFPAHASVTVRVSGPLGATGDISVAARSRATAWTAATGTGAHELVSTMALQPGESIPVEISVRFAPEAGNDTQALALALDVTVTLTADVGPAPPGPPTTTSGGPPSSLPSSGGALARPLATAGGFALAIGVVAVAGSRRRRDA